MSDGTAGKTAFIGDAGEHFVLAELLRRHVTAALAPRNIANYDILAVAGTKSLKIRVKTKTSANSWRWNTKKDGTMFGEATDNDVVVLVDLGNLGSPTYYALTTRDLEEKMKGWMAEYLATPGRTDKGQRFLYLNVRGEDSQIEHSHLEPYEGDNAWALIENMLEISQKSSTT